MLPIIFTMGLLLHYLLVFGGTYFLSPETSLYPYLTSLGLQPYIQLIDQHFPMLFFGPLNLSQVYVTTPQASLIAFITTIFLIDLGAVLTLRKQPILFFAFVFAQYLLHGSTFWLDSYILLFLVWFVFLNNLESLLFKSLSVLSLSLVIAIRPTLLPFALLLLLIKSRPIKPYYLLLATFPLIEIIWLIQNNLWSDFQAMQQFNLNYYAPLAVKFPTIKQLLLAGFIFSPIFVQPSGFLLLLSGLVLIYPRFELYHLLPLTALFLYQKKVPALWLVIVFLLIAKYYFPPSNNFYYPPKLYNQADQLKKHQSGNSLYLFGGPDQLYQLTNSRPIGNYYLPSLPWYLANPDFVEDQIQALKDNPDAIVVVNTQSSLEGISLLDYGKPVWDYIQQNYQQVAQIDELTIYENRD